MKWRDYAAVAVDALADLARDGRIEPGNLWVALKGARTYAMAIAKGALIADEVTAASRFENGCRQCLSMTKKPVRDRGIQAKYGKCYTHWCGVPFEDNTGSVLPTCGCLVGMTVEGKTAAEGDRLYPAGKTTLKEERCPQGLW
jgi:hypothetical protein